MTTPKQADEAADRILAKPRAELDGRREQRQAAARAAGRRRESPFIPALTASVTTWIAMEYLENAVACLLLGTLIGALFGWAARRS